MFVKPYAKGQRPYDLRMVESIASTLGSGNKLTHKGCVYHVKVNPDKDVWDVTCLGTECIDSPYKDKYYRGMENLPVGFPYHDSIYLYMVSQYILYLDMLHPTHLYQGLP